MNELGFVKANSENLPAVDAFMVAEFIENDDRFNIAEIRGAKAESASRESYGDNAVGYVEVKGNDGLCIVKAKICPEHKVRSKVYPVVLIVNEKEDKVEDVQCNECAAAAGGCKHAVAFLMCVHQRYEDPSPTEVTSYWAKPRLASIGTAIKYVEAKEFLAASVNLPLPNNSSFLEDIVAVGKKHRIPSQPSQLKYELPNDKFNKLSLYRLLLRFHKDGGNSCDDFLSFARREILNKLCTLAEAETKSLSRSPLWHELRFGRITASKIYEAAHCQQPNGVYTETVLDAYKIIDTKAMHRGRQLEKKVLATVEKKIDVKLQECGLYLIPQESIFGASPDAIAEDFVVEVKCPSSQRAVATYIKDNTINNKFKTQLHLQMLATQKHKGLFCVAHPDFETSENVDLYWVNSEQCFISEILDKAKLFWKNHIFPKLMNSVSN